MDMLRHLEEKVIEAENYQKELLTEQENLQFKSKGDKENEIQNILDQLRNPTLSIDEKSDLHKKLDALKNEMAIIEKHNNNIKLRRESIYEEIRRAPIKVFRRVEARNNHIKEHFLNATELKGKDIIDYQSVLTRYPFEGLNHCLFILLGNPVQPFIASIYGEKESGKSILGVLIALELIDWLEAKVLYVVDPQNKARVLEYFAMKKIKNDRLTLKITESVQDIEKALSRDDYEFLFIDSNYNFKLNLNNIKKIQLKHKRCSVFCISRSSTSSIVDASHILFETSIYSIPEFGLIKAAEADIYVNGVHDDKQKIGIFLHRDDSGFKIDLL